MRLFYLALSYVLAPFVVLIIVWKGLRNRAYWERVEERFGDVPGAQRVAGHQHRGGEITGSRIDVSCRHDYLTTTCFGPTFPRRRPNWCR